MEDIIDTLKEIANIAMYKYENIKKEHKELSKKVSVGAYGHQSSLMDVSVENAVIEYIKSEKLPFNIFTEEAGLIDRGFEKTLIMDPIDGSYNAEHGIPFFSVSLAVAKNSLNTVEAALVKNIPLNVNYWALKGEGAYRDNKRIHVKGESRLFVIYLGKNASEQAYNVAKRGRRVRDLGSASLEMITVAEGIADLFFYSFRKGGALRIVDIAASTLIVREAGGVVLDDNFGNLDMKLDFSERKNVIALANDSYKEVFQ